MVRIYNVYNFAGQMVDSIDDMLALALTSSNLLLIAQSDYTVEVKDLLSDKKTPLFVFPTVDKVHDIDHCSAGNYVATVEGKQSFQKSDVLIVRIYTNWEPNDLNGTKTGKRFITPRIAGVVSPSITSPEDDFLDTIEIPITFMSPTTITTCQKSGRLVIACGPTIHVFDQAFKHGSSSSVLYMDFIALAEVFDLVFQPCRVVINVDIIGAHCDDMISVFHLTDAGANYQSGNSVVEHISSNEANGNSCSGLDEPLNIDKIISKVISNRQDELKDFLSPGSFPFKVTLKGMGSVSGKAFPFTTMRKKPNPSFKNGKVEDTYVVTLNDLQPSIIAESILALKIDDDDPCERINSFSLDVLMPNTSKFEKYGFVNVFFATHQDGYLFSGFQKDIRDGLHYKAVYNFTARVLNASLQACFLHVLTEAGLETYNLPTLNSIVYQNLTKKPLDCSAVTLFGLRPFLGVTNFLVSDKLLTLFASANDE